MKTKSQIDREKHSALDEYFMMITTATLIRSNENLMWHWKLLIALWPLDVSGLLYEAFIVHQWSNVKVWGDLSGLFVSALVDYRKCFSELCSSLFYRDHICFVGHGWKNNNSRSMTGKTSTWHWQENYQCVLLWIIDVSERCAHYWSGRQQWQTSRGQPFVRVGGGCRVSGLVGASAIVAVSVGCY